MAVALVRQPEMVLEIVVHMTTEHMGQIQDFPLRMATNPIGVGANVQCGHFSAKMYVKAKELGGGGGHTPGVPPGSTKGIHPCPFCGATATLYF